MRALSILHPIFNTLVKSVQEALLSRQKGGNPDSYRKGGDPALQTVWRITSMLSLEKEMKSVYKQKPFLDLQNVNPLIRAADWVRTKGQIRPISDDPVPEEQIGILFNIVRRRKNLTVERLAEITGYRMEELIAFEAGMLPRRRMLEMLSDLARHVGFAYKELLQTLQQQNKNNFNK